MLRNKGDRRVNDEILKQIETELASVEAKHPHFADMVDAWFDVERDILSFADKAHNTKVCRVRIGSGKSCAANVILGEVYEALAAGVDPADTIEHARQETCHAIVTLIRFWHNLPELKRAQMEAQK
jgi:hypothetical protein